MSEESRGELRIETVNRDGFQEAVDVLSEAFFDYPVMRYVIGDVGEDYSRRLRHLVSFFTEARFTRKDLVLVSTCLGRDRSSFQAESILWSRIGRRCGPISGRRLECATRSTERRQLARRFLTRTTTWE
jgi:hypothetical protein